MKENHRKSVSVILPIYNEENYIAECLDSLLAQDYSGPIEILALDGCSTDATPDILSEYSKKHKEIKVVNNPKMVQVYALNMGIKKAAGEIIVRADAHTVYEQDYISNCVRLLNDTEASNVGGMQHPIGKKLVDKAIALATSSPFGVGNAKFRYVSDEEHWVDTVYLGAWEKRTLEELNGFNEEWEINEDYELNYRLRKAGGKILLSPEIKCHYWVRASLPKLVRQYFRYGLWKTKTLRTHPQSLVWRQLVPPIFVAAFIISTIALFFSNVIGLIVIIPYMLACMGYSTKLSLKEKSFKYLFVLPVIFFVIHFSWGLGFIFGIIKG